MIRLQEATLLRFGKFTDYTLQFSDGLQVIYGGNEAGKSTMQLFLKVMLYGISGNKKDEQGLKIRERIIPWEEKSAEGILRLDIDGRTVEIRRKFGKTAAGDKTSVVDFHTGEPVAEYESSSIGEALLGIPESVFEKVFWLKQSGVVFSGSDEELNIRLMNLLETGAEDLSVEGTLKELEEEKKRVKAKDKRGVPGDLDRLWKLREEKTQERYQLLSERGQREAEERLLKEETQKLDFLRREEARLQGVLERKKEILALDSRRKKWVEAERFVSLAKQAEERDAYRRFLHLDEPVVQNAENLEKQRETLDQTSSIEYDIENEDKALLKKQTDEKRFGALVMVGVGLIVFSVLVAVLRFFLWGVLTTAFGLAGIFLTIFSFLKMQHSKNEAWQTAERQKNLQADLEKTQKELRVIEDDLLQILSAYGCKNTSELREGFLLCKQAKLEAEGYRRTYEAMLEGEDLSKISSKMQKIDLALAQNEDILSIDAETELQQVRQGQIDCVAKIKETEGKISYVFHGGLNPADVETELRQIHLQIDALEKRYKALELAISVLEQVAEKRKSDFTPKVNEKVNLFLDILTNGKYQDVRVSKEYRMRLLPDKSQLYQAEFFSTGTYEQVYFALRLSLASLLGDGTEPLFLDDFLTAYDDQRAGYAMDLLKQLSEKHQILLFSCHGREADNAAKRGITIRYLEEE